jgi:hypothetical protein
LLESLVLYLSINNLLDRINTLLIEVYALAHSQSNSHINKSFSPPSFHEVLAATHVKQFTENLGIFHEVTNSGG